MSGGTPARALSWLKDPPGVAIGPRFPWFDGYQGRAAWFSLKEVGTRTMETPAEIVHRLMNHQ